MAGIDSTWGSTYLQRNEIFSEQLKELLRDQLIAQQYVRWMSDIPSDSIRTQLQINSIGELEVDDWQESVALPERRMDTGRFNFNIDEFKGVKVPFTDHFFETSFQANEVLARTPERMKRAMDVYLETKIMELANEQTLDDANAINGASHRFAGSGDGTNGAPVNHLRPEDFAYAKYALKKANVPMTGMVAVVSPEEEFYLSTQSNITDISFNPRWEGIIETGLLDTTGIRFIRNIYGFDIYVSEYIAETGNEANITTYDGTAVGDTTGYNANMFFSVADDMVKPFVGAWGRTPRMVSWRDEDIETEYHQLTSSFGLALYRPESLVTVMTPNSI